ncbi:outer membrane beta-barrel protein [Hydrogenophaga sp.]|uniref:outer membrane beta-barrel protein n=1 Tax=Hydrogenophaga sp. TaxID=1904254 RepID=UPI0025BAD1F7|nr:outer membrane beta-barrel protein [Hydrogenophaga sp.]MBT9463037.1 outer membrane beta-barrel protein [Hydrogenophaga sp.]
MQGSTVPGASSSDATMAQATTSNSTGQRRMYDSSTGSYSVIPYATNGYIGLNVGKPDWDTPCGGGGFACSESNTSYNIYTGGMFNEHFGAELGYVDFGRSDRGGGRTHAHGVNISLVGHLPLGGLNLFAKVGTLYGRTKVNASPLAGIGSGSDSGWEGSYGVGVGFNLSPRSSVVLEWNRYDLNFVGVGRRDITTTSLGYVHRF